MKFRVIAIIPARGGSKGLKRKNLRMLDDKPLIAYSIEAALQATLIDSVYVSSEDEEILRVARDYGASTIVRPHELAIDTAQNDIVIRHSLEEIGARDNFDIIVLLQPTSPLRRSEHIDKCVETLFEEGVKSTMSVCRVDHHPGKSVLIHDNEIIPYTNYQDIEARRQDMMEVYRQNGAVYALRIEDFFEQGKFYIPPCRACVMHKNESVDIDDELDLVLAEVLIENAKSRNKQK